MLPMDWYGPDSNLVGLSFSDPFLRAFFIFCFFLNDCTWRFVLCCLLCFSIINLHCFERFSLWHSVTTYWLTEAVNHVANHSKELH